MNQVDRNTSNSSSKGNADKTAVLPTQNSPKQNAAHQAKQGGNMKSGDSDAAGKGKRDAAPRTDKDAAAQGNKPSNDHNKR